MTFREWCVAACLLMAGLSAEFELVPLPARMGGAAELLHFGGTLENCTHSDMSAAINCETFDPNSQVKCTSVYSIAMGSQLWLDVLGVEEVVCIEDNCRNIEVLHAHTTCKERKNPSGGNGNPWGG